MRKMLALFAAAFLVAGAFGCAPSEKPPVAPPVNAPAETKAVNAPAETPATNAPAETKPEAKKAE